MESNSYTLGFSTYLGGQNIDYGQSIAVDSNDNVIVAGTTGSTNFPMKNAYNATFGGIWDSFVAKFNATGFLLWSI